MINSGVNPWPAVRRHTTGVYGQSAGLILLAAILMGPAFWQGGIYAALDIMSVTLPWAETLGRKPFYNPLIVDPAVQYLPWRNFAYETLRAGQWPLWNPYIFSGHPTFGSINEQIFYLPNYLFAFMPAERSFGWLTLFHLSLTGIGARAFARLHVDDDSAACLAGVAAMLGGPLIVWLQYPALMSTIAWSGAIFYFAEMTLRTRRPIYAAFTGLMIGLQLLAGMSQYSLYVLALLALYAATRLISIAFRERIGLVPAMSLLLCSATIGISIGALAYLPALELQPQAHRGVLTLEELRQNALAVSDFILYVLPNTFGNPIRGDFVGKLNFIEATSYLGLLSLLLVPLSLLVGRRSAVAAGFLALSLVLIAIQLGNDSVIALLAKVPGFNLFVPNRVVGLLPFLLGVVGAVTWALLPARTNPHRILRSSIAFAAIAGVAAAIWFVGREQFTRPGPATHATSDIRLALIVLSISGAVILARIWLPRLSPVRWLGPLVLAADLVLFGGNLNTVVPTNPAAGPPPAPLHLVPTGPMAARTVGLQVEEYVLGPNLGMNWNIPTPDGYTSQYLVRYRNFVTHASPEKTIPWLRLFTNLTTFTQLRAPYLDLLGVRYVAGPADPLVSDTLRTGNDAKSEPIAGNKSIGVVFRARQNGLNRIDLYPNPGTGGAPSWVALHVKRDPATPDHVSYIRIDNPKMQPGEPLSFYFNPIPDSSGKQYYVYIDAPEARPDQAFTLDMTRADAPPGAVRLVDDRPADGTLRFTAFAVPMANWRKIETANRTTLYENPEALPRAYMVHRVQVLNEEAFYDALDDGSFDPQSMAAVETPPSAVFRVATTGAAPPRTPVDIVRSDPLSIDLRVAPRLGGLLVISNSWYDGWRAEANGQALPIVRVNGVFQGVYLAPGTHLVRLQFDPQSLRRGLAASLGGLTLAVVAIAIDFSRRKRRRRPKPPEKPPVTMHMNGHVNSIGSYERR